MSDDAAPDDPRVVARRWPLGRRQRVWLSFIRRRWGRVAAVAAIAAGVIGIVGHLLGGVAGLWEFYRATAHPQSPAANAATTQPRPFRSVAILPLAAQAPANADMAASLTGDLTAAASRALREGLVASAALTERYRGSTPDPRRVGAELNVRYVVTGVLRERNGTTELALDLADSVDGAHLWSGSAPLSASDAGNAVARLGNDLRGAVATATQKEALSLPPAQREAWRLVIDAWGMPGGADVEAKRQPLLEQALAADPQFVPALLGLQVVLFNRAQNEPERRAAHVRRLDELSQRATAVAPTDPRVWNWRAYALQWQQNWSGALAASDEALRLDPYRGESLTTRAGLLVYSGRPEDALAILDRAERVDGDPFAVDMWRCVAFEQLARDRDALAPCERTASRWSYWVIFALVTAAYANLGERERAEVWAQRTRDAYPQFTIARLRELGVSDHPEFVARGEHIREGLRKAGMPER